MLDFIKSVSAVFLLTLAAFSWHSCQKDNALATKSNSSPEQQSTEREGLNCAQIKNTVYKSEGMLVFTDEQHFYDCIECLEQELEAYNDAYVAFDGNRRQSFQNWSGFKDYKKRKVRRIKEHIPLLWREAIVCIDDPMWPTNRCGLGFFVDNDSHGFAIYLYK